MDRFGLYAANFFPDEELFTPEANHTCPGCGVSLAVRQVGKAVGRRLQGAVFSRGKAVHGLESAAAFLVVGNGKNELVLCLDDEPSGTLEDAASKGLPRLAAEQGFHYVACASPSYPFDLNDKLRTALATEGDSYIHILCPCPAGWDFPLEDTVKMGFRAVESQAFPLYEIKNGTYHLTNETLQPRPLEDYLKAQARFAKVADGELARVKERILAAYQDLLLKNASARPVGTDL
ncbi:MAG: hypothetical protein MUC50_02435 [Myxococcota bacterium]|jgi:pyruvate/2-oxoacid:ferredoxin oxidoreductase beta subunit|nr:hypothetical protein [Myxococcota bacterium]